METHVILTQSPPAPSLELGVPSELCSHLFTCTHMYLCSSTIIISEREDGE